MKWPCRPGARSVTPPAPAAGTVPEGLVALRNCPELGAPGCLPPRRGPGGRGVLAGSPGGRLFFRGVERLRQVVGACTPGSAGHFDVPAVFQDPVQEGFGEIIVMEHSAPLAQGFVRGVDGWPLELITRVDDGVEDVRRILGVGEVAEFIDHQHFGGDEWLRLHLEFSGAGRRGEVVDEMCCRDEPSVSTVLDGRKGDGDGQVGLPPAGLAGEHQVASRSGEIRCQTRGDEITPEPSFGSEREILDGLEVREFGDPGQALNSGLVAIEDFADDQMGKEFPVSKIPVDGQAFGFCQATTHGGERQSGQQEVQIAGRWIEISRHGWAAFHGKISTLVASPGRGSAPMISGFSGRSARTTWAISQES